MSEPYEVQTTHTPGAPVPDPEHPSPFPPAGRTEGGLAELHTQQIATLTTRLDQAEKTIAALTKRADLSKVIAGLTVALQLLLAAVRGTRG